MKIKYDSSLNYTTTAVSEAVDVSIKVFVVIIFIAGFIPIPAVYIPIGVILLILLYTLYLTDFFAGKKQSKVPCCFVWYYSTRFTRLTE